MKFVLLVVFVIGCGPAAAVVTPTPQIVYVTAPTPPPTPAPTFTSKRFGITISAMPVGDDAAPERISDYLASHLPAAWNLVTAGRSSVVAGSDVLIVVDSSKNPRQTGWGVSAPIRLIVLHEIDGASMDTYTKVAVHELGHALGCCHGEGSDGVHIAGCPVGSALFPKNAALMCPSGGDAPTFNGYELGQMGL